MRSSNERVRWARRGTRFGGALLTIAAILLATFLGGRRYFYCRMMNDVMSADDCACAPHLDSRERAAIQASDDCLELRTLDRLHSFTVGSNWVVPVATLVATLPPTPLTFSPMGSFASKLDRPIRAGPESPAAARAQLMVFLT